jgi:hypothetical protein
VHRCNSRCRGTSLVTASVLCVSPNSPRNDNELVGPSAGIPGAGAEHVCSYLGEKWVALVDRPGPAHLVVHFTVLRRVRQVARRVPGSPYPIPCDTPTPLFSLASQVYGAERESSATSVRTVRSTCR